MFITIIMLRVESYNLKIMETYYDPSRISENVKLMSQGGEELSLIISKLWRFTMIHLHFPKMLNLRLKEVKS